MAEIINIPTNYTGTKEDLKITDNAQQDTDVALDVEVSATKYENAEIDRLADEAAQALAEIEAEDRYIPSEPEMEEPEIINNPIKIDPVVEIENKEDVPEEEPEELDAFLDNGGIIEEKGSTASEFMDTMISGVRDPEAAATDEGLAEERGEITIADPESDAENGESEDEEELTDEEKNRIDFETLKTLPYIELYSQKSQAKAQVEELTSSKSMMDQIGDLSQDDSAAIIAQMDEAEKLKYKDSVNSFYTQYPSMYAEAHRIETLLAKMVSIFSRDLVASTTFISQSMVEAAEVRKAKIMAANPVPINRDNLVKRLDTTKNAYADRTNFDFLFNKLRYPNQTLETYKKFVHDGPEAALKFINSTFMPVFNDQNMAKFRNAFKSICMVGKEFEARMEVTDVTVFFLTYWLAKMYEKEYQSGKCAYVKTFVMNFYDLDPSSMIYDLDGGRDYMFSVGYTLYMIILTSTSGQFTEKQLHKNINYIIDDLMGMMKDEKKDLFAKYPGKKLGSGTSLSELYPDTYYDTMIAEDEAAEDDAEALGESDGETLEDTMEKFEDVDDVDDPENPFASDDVSGDDCCASDSDDADESVDEDAEETVDADEPENIFETEADSGSGDCCATEAEDTTEVVEPTTPRPAF